jgi:uncharacterized protein YbbC (DUF1343 family)
MLSFPAFHSICLHLSKINHKSFMQQPIQSGIDVFLTQAAAYTNKRFALVTNNAATTSTGLLSRVALLQEGFTITKLFSPEHGITRLGEDGAPQPNQTDPITSLPVISLYGEKRKPTLADLADIDEVLFDIPDIGCRFYTYLWTLTHVMQSCAQYHKPLIILDRPNPIGTQFTMAEGPFLDEAHCASFIGRWSIPLRHSCTLGELALYFAATKLHPLQLTVIPVYNYHRHTRHQLSFVPTSPAIQHIETALLYPGTGLLEGINVNEGRGTDTPFELCGAPWINKEDLLNAWLTHNIPGISTASITYTPQDGIYAFKTCHGLQFTITNPQILKPVAMGIALLQTLLQLYPQQVTQRPYPTAANPTGTLHLDKLLGIPNAFERLKAGQQIDTNTTPTWEETMKEYVLY